MLAVNDSDSSSAILSSKSLRCFSLRSLKALWAALFCALRLFAGSTGSAFLPAFLGAGLATFEAFSSPGTIEGFLFTSDDSHNEAICSLVLTAGLELANNESVSPVVKIGDCGEKESESRDDSGVFLVSKEGGKILERLSVKPNGVVVCKRDEISTSMSGSLIGKVFSLKSLS